MIDQPVPVRGYPETFQQRRAYIKPPPCGNEMYDSFLERVCSS
jgi:hypothetical protein